MAEVTRSNKSAGGTAFVDGTDILATEVNDDLDTLYNEMNGGLDKDNISASAQIPNSALVDIDGTKVSDHSDNAATAATTTTPGDSSTLGSNLATNIEEEIERLRFAINQAKGYSGVEFRDSTDTNVAAAWVEPPVQGRNLLANPGFELFSGSSGDPPDSWTEVGTLATSGLVAAANPTTGGHKRTFNFTTNASTEGISQTVEGLKASTKYLFGVQYTITSGGVLVESQGGLAAGNNYQDPSESDATAGGVETIQQIVQTDATPTDLTIRILGSSGTDNVNLVQAWFYELSDEIPAVTPPSIPEQTATVSSEISNVPATVNSATDWTTNWTDVPSLDLSQYIPVPGYRLIYEVTLAWASDLDDSQYFFGFRLEQDDGSTSVVDGPYVESSDQFGFSEDNAGGTITLRHTVENPTPGATYTFTPQVTAADSVGGVGKAPRLHPLIAITAGGTASAGSNSALQTISKARLRVERI